MEARSYRGQGRAHKLTGRDYAVHALKEMQKRDHQEIMLERAYKETSKDFSFGRLEWSIPEDHYALLTMVFPDLVCVDAEIKTKAYKKLRAEPLAQIYKIRTEVSSGR